MQREVRNSAFNVVTNLVIFLTTILLSFWFTPYLINQIGEEKFGFVTLASNLADYLQLVTLGITAGFGRFLSIELSQKNTDGARRVFNTGFFSILAILFIVVIISVGLVAFAPVLFNIPAGAESSVRKMFAFVFGAFCITTLSTSFSVTSFARNKLYLKNIFKLIDRLLRVFLVVFIFQFVKPDLWYVGLGIFAAVLISFFGDLGIWKKLTPELIISRKFYDRGILKKLYTFGGWHVLNIMGALMYLQSDPIILNWTRGPRETGQFVAISVFALALRVLANNITDAISPYFVKLYGHGELDKLRNTSILMVKYFGLVFGVAAGILAGLSAPLLSVWINPSYAELAPVFIIMMMHLPVNLANVPLFDLIMTYNKVKVPGIVTLVLGVVNVVMGVFFSLWWGLIGIAIADAVMLLVKNTIFTPIYVANFQNLPWTTYLKPLIPGVIGSFLCLGSGLWISNRFVLDGWMKLIAAAIVIGLAFLVYAVLVIRNKQEVLSLVKGIRGK